MFTKLILVRQVLTMLYNICITKITMVFRKMTHTVGKYVLGHYWPHYAKTTVGV